jgi:hypothetical protein
MINIKSWDKPLYIDNIDKNWQKNQKFYVRSGNSSQELNTLEEITWYIKKRF